MRTHLWTLPPVVVVGWLVLLAGPLRAQARPQPVSEVKCAYTRKVVCDSSDCKVDAIRSRYLLLPDVSSMVTATALDTNGRGLPTIRQCDSAGCDGIVVRAWQNGAFVDITQPDRSYFIKIATVELASVGVHAGDFVQVEASGFGTTLYFGSCKAAVK
ncbi:MAG TPA: hypothetical protein VMX54_08510 [Vicinamibacteria bacterium]|nr:hypothetical protein [Vicinamibacteria bacterium]